MKIDIKANTNEHHFVTEINGVKYTVLKASYDLDGTWTLKARAQDSDA